MIEDLLVIIPARGGSKGIPGKNIKLLGSKPLIYYSTEIARKLFKDDLICVSTDDENIIKIVEKTGLKVPFIRPSSLSEDNSTTQNVILHALNYYYDVLNKKFTKVLLLQPTSPFRKILHINEALKRYNPNLDMVVSVKRTKANPYYTLFEFNKNGFIQKSKTANFTNRQKCPLVYELNGSIYVYNAKSLKKKKVNEFNKIIPYEMEEKYSIDIDDDLDWDLAEIILKKYIKSEEIC